MKEMLLSKGELCLVSDEDYDWICHLKWYRGTCGYAVVYIYCPKTKKQHGLFMHRVILRLKSNESCDHINGNRLDNRRENLRIATQAENVRNASAQKGSTSKFKGVYWNKRRKKWHSQVRIGSTRFHLGFYKEEEEAGRAYDKKASELFGEFARLNFPTQCKEKENG